MMVMIISEDSKDRKDRISLKIQLNFRYFASTEVVLINEYLPQPKQNIHLYFITCLLFYFGGEKVQTKERSLLFLDPRDPHNTVLIYIIAKFPTNFETDNDGSLVTLLKLSDTTSIAISEVGNIVYFFYSLIEIYF